MSSESSTLTVQIFHVVHVTVDVLVTFVQSIQAEFFEDSSSEKKTSAISSGIICEANFDAIPWQLVTVSGTQDMVTFNLGGSDLTNYVLVGDPDDQPPFRRVVLVLDLNNEPFPGIIVCLSFSSSTELHLEPFEVSLVLDHFHERLFVSIDVEIIPVGTVGRVTATNEKQD